MQQALDFRVPFDPDKDTQETLTEKIIYSLIIRNRLLAKKPAVIFICGDSGEGKSYSTIMLQYILCKLQLLNIYDFFDLINVHTPLQYPQKLSKILYDKAYKKVNMICIHEARDLVGAKNWYTFLTRTIADVNAMSRGVKRLCIMIVSQFIRDISTDIRYSLNYYIKVQRNPRQNARLFINVLWKDDRDLEKPKLRKRRLRGWLIYPDGRKRLFMPKYLELGMPPRDLTEQFDKDDYEAKAKIIHRKLEKLIKEMEIEAGLEDYRVNALVEWLVKPENYTALNQIGRRVRKKWRINPEAKLMYNITEMEAQSIEDLLPKKMRELKIIDDSIEAAEKESEENITEGGG